MSNVKNVFLRRLTGAVLLGLCCVPATAADPAADVAPAPANPVLASSCECPIFWLYDVPNSANDLWYGLYCAGPCEDCDSSDSYATDMYGNWPPESYYCCEEGCDHDACILHFRDDGLPVPEELQAGEGETPGAGPLPRAVLPTKKDPDWKHNLAEGVQGTPHGQPRFIIFTSPGPKSRHYLAKLFVYDVKVKGTKEPGTRGEKSIAVAFEVTHFPEGNNILVDVIDKSRVTQSQRTAGVFIIHPVHGPDILAVTSGP